jgi:hypothetical protein
MTVVDIRKHCHACNQKVEAYFTIPMYGILVRENSELVFCESCYDKFSLEIKPSEPFETYLLRIKQHLIHVKS